MRNTPTSTIPTDEIMLFSVDQAATVLGIGRTNVYALIGRGELRSVKVGGRRLVPRIALEAFVTQMLGSD
ncbi:MAG: helix-turn-helix domain-containing protein [Actinomycetota bacterium]